MVPWPYHWLRGALPLLLTLTLTPQVALAGYSLVGWNNLGMHCMDGDYSVLSLLPPYNTIHAQLVDPQGRLVTQPGAISITYRAVADPDGSINTTSIGKTNFWEHAPSLFGVALSPDVGLLGLAMPGASNVPRAMQFDPAHQWWIAEGIPITPYDDRGGKNPYPLMRLEARDGSGTLLASVDIVLPVSDEMDCAACHASGSGAAAQPGSGWANDPDPQRDYRFNILRLHDEKHLGEALYASALAARGYDAAGLNATVVGSGKSVLCASCHLSEALPGSGFASISPLTRAVHGLHAGVKDPLTSLSLGSSENRSACYRCHPGSVTRCLRGAMGAAVAPDGTLAMQCQSCHGSMAAVAAPARTGWLDEPACQSCHTGTAVHNNGQIRYASVYDATGQVRSAVDSTFATSADAPAPGFSLFRFSTGHGGLACEACHGSTHAEFPSSHRNDNLASFQRQGHVGMLAECTACHATQPETTSGGPHGMHPVGQTWVARHADAAEGGAAQCRSCHGADSRGTELSRSQADRTLSTEFGSKHFWRGFQIGCYTCHRGPGSEDANPNRAPVVSNASIATAVGVPMPVALSARDADGNRLKLRIVSQAAHGTVGLQGVQATYFPDADFSGSDSFTFAAWDGSTDSNLGTVSVSVGGGGGCDYALTPPGQTLPPAGGTGSVALATASGCGWAAQSSAPWLRVDSASTGSGAATVRFSVAGNPLPAGRVATIAIGGQTFELTQSGATVPGCAPAPVADCRQSVVAGAGSLALSSKSPAKRALTWSWKKGEATALADFGAPATSDAYALCVYDESSSEAQLLIAAVAPAGGSCGSKPCWRPSGKSELRYRDPAATPDGLTALKLHAGVQGKASVAASARGPQLGLPFLPLPLPLRVQLQSGSGTCFEATFSASAHNGAKSFKARSD